MHHKHGGSLGALPDPPEEGSMPDLSIARRLGVGLLATTAGVTGLVALESAQPEPAVEVAYSTLGGGGSVGGYYNCYWTRSGRKCYWVSTGTGGGGSW
jgi:hypothetical protein